jgi:sulfur carrier protein
MPDSSIRINGKPHPLEATVTVTALLESLGLAGKPVVVELNGDALLRDNYERTEVRPGASLEIVTLAAGG